MILISYILYHLVSKEDTSIGHLLAQYQKAIIMDGSIICCQLLKDLKGHVFCLSF